MLTNVIQEKLIAFTNEISVPEDELQLEIKSIESQAQLEPPISPSLLYKGELSF